MASDRVVLGLHSVAPGSTSPEERPTFLGPKPDRQDKALVHVLEMSFVGARSDVQLVPGSPQEGKTNYLKGADPSRWVTEVGGYSSVTYKEIYEGVDLHFYDKGGLLAYDFYIAPGANPTQIRLQFGGHQDLVVDEDGRLHVGTPHGELVHTAPVAYQLIGDRKVLVPAAFTADGGESAKIEVGAHDQAHPLIIDPTMSWSTYLGGSYRETDAAVAVGSSGEVFVTGSTHSSDFPTTSGVLDGTFDGNSDAFVTKLSSTGSSLVYSTYIGGSDDDGGASISVDSADTVTVAGVTESPDFPTTPSAYDVTYGGPTGPLAGDAFVARISAAGSSLVYATYLGGSEVDNAADLVVLADGSTWILGSTGSSDFPVTPSAYDVTYNSGSDAFVARLNRTGSSVLYSTFLGGSGSDSPWALSVGSAGAIYLAGETMSADFPTTAGAFDVTKGGDWDAFVTKLIPGSPSLAFSTFLGGNEVTTYLVQEGATDLELGADGSVYVVGWTSASDFPTTPGAYDTTFNGFAIEPGDGFVARLAPAGNSLLFSTFLGGSSGDHVATISVDTDGSLFLVGYTESSDFPVTANATDNSFNGGQSDTFLSRLSASGAQLVYSTFIGGTGFDAAEDLAIDHKGKGTLVGLTSSSDFPTKAGAFDTTFNGTSTLNMDVFVSHFSLTCPRDTPLATDYSVEGSTQAGFEEWLLLSNPDPVLMGLACVTVITASGPAGAYSFDVPPLSRVSVPIHTLVDDPEVSLRIDSYNTRIYSERALYVDSGGRRGAHLGKSQPVSSASTISYIPEGFTAESSETWVLVANPLATETATADFFFQTGEGELQGPQDVRIPPLTRRTIRVDDYVPNSYLAATRVTSDRPILTERASYLGHSGLSGATASPGISSLQERWLIPEGATAGPFEDWVLLSNPTSAHVNARVRFMTNSGALSPVSVHLMPGQRVSIKADDYVDSYYVAALIEADHPLAAERALYTRRHPSYGDTASSAEALDVVSDLWLAPEGATAGGFETWTLVSNPHPTETAAVSVDYLTESGIVPGPQNFSLGPRQRVSFRANDYVTTYHAAARVRVVTGPKVGVDHSIYPPPGMLGRDATSGPGTPIGAKGAIP